MKDFSGILRLVILLWFALLVYCLCRAEQEQMQVYEPVEEAVEPVTVEIIPEEPSIEETLAKLPSVENATLTHYCICEKCCGKTPDDPAYGITASGRRAEPNMSVAVDPMLIPLGSKVYVDNGDGQICEYRADDTGSSITGARIDLCVSNHQEALELGKKTVSVWWEEDRNG